jgi:hypothetical protein
MVLEFFNEIISMGYIPEIDIDPIMAHLNFNGKLIKKNGQDALYYAIYDNKYNFGQAKRFVFDIYLNSSLNRTI